VHDGHQQVILEVLPHAGQLVPRRDAGGAQLVARADSRQE
jgi:hypothetical protein